MNKLDLIKPRINVKFKPGKDLLRLLNEIIRSWSTVTCVFR